MTRRRWRSLAPVLALPLAGCAVVTNAAAGTGPVWQTLAFIATWSWPWLVPALMLYVGRAYDRAEHRTVSGTGWAGGERINVEVSVPTGRTIAGDPEDARHNASIWLLLYPLGLAYFMVWALVHISGGHLTSYPNLDSVLLNAVFPLGIIILVVVAHRVVLRSRSPLARLLVRLWKGVILLGTINFLGWYAFVGYRWLTKRDGRPTVQQVSPTSRPAAPSSRPLPPPAAISAADAAPLLAASKAVLGISPAAGTEASVTAALKQAGVTISGTQTIGSTGDLTAVHTAGATGYPVSDLSSVSYNFDRGVLNAMSIVRKAPDVAAFTERFKVLRAHFKVTEQDATSARLQGSGLELKLYWVNGQLVEFYQLLSHPLL